MATWDQQALSLLSQLVDNDQKNAEAQASQSCSQSANVETQRLHTFMPLMILPANAVESKKRRLSRDPYIIRLNIAL